MKLLWLIFPLIVGFGFLVHRERKASAASRTQGPPMSNDATYTLEFWRPLVEARLAEFHPATAARPGALDFAMAWLNYESNGGNPCAYGDPPPSGTAPDGQPREIGLGQLYNPDDFARIAPKVAPLGIKLTSKSLRAYCKPGTQIRTRNLTSDEMIAQIEATLLVPIDEGIAWADAALMKGKLNWLPVDVWKLVKAHHAYPPILNMLAPLATRGPIPSWKAYRAKLNQIDAWAPDATSPDSVTENNPKGYKNFALHRGFEMCERCGEATAAAIQAVS